MTEGWRPPEDSERTQQWPAQPPTQPTPGQWGAQPPTGQWGTQPPAQQWGAGPAQPAPYPTYQAFAPKPGVIPLRPLRLGEIWEGAIGTIRGNPSATFGLSFLVNLIVAIPSLLTVTWISGISFDGDPSSEVYQTGSRSILQIVDYFLGAIGSVVLAGLLSYVVSQAVLGRRVSIGQTWRQSRGRLLPLIGMTLIVVAGAVAVIGVVVGVIVLLATAASGALAALVGIPLAIAAVVALIWAWVRLSLAPPAVVLEKAGPIRGLQRSWTLTRGSFWRIFGITLLTRFIVGIISSFLAFPAALLGLALGAPVTLLLIITVVWSALVGAVLSPFVAYVSGLLYIGERIRKEALDVSLMAAAAQ